MVGGVVSISKTVISVLTVPPRTLLNVTFSVVFVLYVLVKVVPLDVQPDRDPAVWSKVTVTVTLPLVHVAGV
jgi:hypothetical protein